MKITPIKPIVPTPTGPRKPRPEHPKPKPTPPGESLTPPTGHQMTKPPGWLFSRTDNGFLVLLNLAVFMMFFCMILTACGQSGGGGSDAATASPATPSPTPFTLAGKYNTVRTSDTDPTCIWCNITCQDDGSACIPFSPLSWPTSCTTIGTFDFWFDSSGTLAPLVANINNGGTPYINWTNAPPQPITFTTTTYPNGVSGTSSIDTSITFTNYNRTIIIRPYGANTVSVYFGPGCVLEMSRTAYP